MLDYSEYRHFLPVIDKAREACENSQYTVANHFEDILEMVKIGSGAKGKVEDVRLWRYACYLIVQNGDPSKPVIANGQTYFALQTRRQELEDHATTKHQTNRKRKHQPLNKPPPTKITHCLHNFFFGVHHKRPMAHNGFFYRLAT